MTADLTPAERATVDRFDAAVPAPESLRERVARACWKAAHINDTDWPLLNDWARGMYLGIADAAIEVITGGAA